MSEGAIILVVLYFLPTFIAASNRRRQAWAIFALNMLLGWTLIGWVGAFVWAMIADRPAPQPVVVVIRREDRDDVIQG
jgi:hypothetical protein